MNPALTDLAVAVLLGGAFGVGVCLLLALTRRVGAVSLPRRLMPYLRDVVDPLGLGPAISPGPAVRSAVLDALHALTGRAGGSGPLQQRLDQAGWMKDPSAFRLTQLFWAVGGTVLGGVLVVVLVLAGRFSPVVVLVPLLTAGGAGMAYDLLLTRAGRARTRRVEEELPTVLDFLALCLAAGEGILDALRRVSAIGSGELTGELRQAVLAVGAGAALGEELTALGRRMRLPALARTLDQIVAALERGAPLAHVLHDQAADAREDAKRQLIEQAGRKEILMLVPLVFLILPLSVLYAVFPGVFLLQIGLG